MRSPKYLAIALAALSLGLFVAPKATACGSCGVLNQSAILDTTLTSPVVIDTTLMQPSVIDTTLMQPSVLDTTSTLPVIIDQPTVLRLPAYDDFYRTGRHHLFNFSLF